MRVGVFQEWTDIVRWLPSIAANSDLPKSSWDKINQQCEKLSELTSRVVGDSAADRHEVYQQNAAAIEQILDALQAETEDYQHWDDYFPG